MLETIYNNIDLGYYSCLDGYVYTKQNDLVSIASNYTINDRDSVRIDTSNWKTDFYRDDDNIENGNGHIKYTIDELMIMGYGMSKQGFPIEVKMEDCLNKEYKFNLPNIAGILRLCARFSNQINEHFSHGITLYINNVNMLIPSQDYGSVMDPIKYPGHKSGYRYGGYAFKITEELFNKEVKFTTTSNSGYNNFIFYFLPYVYPVEEI